MDSSFQDKSIKVYAVDGSGANRTLLTEILRKAGYQDVTGLPSLKDVIAQLETEGVGWVITPLMLDQPVNALHLLRLATENPELKDLRVSIFAEEEEYSYLPAAFQSGLLSFFEKPYTKDTLAEQMNQFGSEFEKWNFESPLLSASYLRSYLKDHGSPDEWLKFEKKLFSIYPSYTNLLLEFVPPMVKMGMTDEGKATLKRAKFLDSSLEAQIADYTQKYLNGESIEEAEGEAFNFLGLEKVVVVDPDEVVQNQIKEALGELGITDIQSFSDGESASDYIKENPDPGLVIMEWRLPKLTGPLFLQRIKAAGAEATPIVVLSSLLQESDTPLLKEMGVAAAVKKPFDQSALVKDLITTIEQDRKPSDQASMERKMREDLRLKKLEDAMAIQAKYMAESSISQGAKEAIAAEFAFAQRQYESARDHGIEAIKLNGDSLFILSLLGKSLMLLREFDLALKCFKKAQQISPMNIERLCQMAEVQSEMGDEEGAKETLNDASEIDADNQNIDQTKAKIAINAGDTVTAKEIMAKLDEIDNVVSFMNNSAVAMARCAMVDQGIEQYRKTLKSIPDDREETKAIVMYNLALAHARASELEEAKIHLGRCVKVESRVRIKAKNLMARISKALDEGSDFNLNLNNSPLAALPPPSSGQGNVTQGTGDPEADLPEINLEILRTVSSKPGDLACFKIFSTSQIDKNVKQKFANPPRFAKRSAIERAESAGADKVIAAG